MEASAPRRAAIWWRSIALALAVLIGVPCAVLVVLYLVLMAIVGGRPF